MLPCGVLHRQQGQEEEALPSRAEEPTPPNQIIKDLNWALQEIRSGETPLQSVSFHLQQGSTGAYQETESSMTIKISTGEDSTDLFSQILSAMAVERETLQSIQNLEFHGVEWGLEELRHLGYLVDKRTDRVTLVFRRNAFGVQGFSLFAEILKVDRRIKAITLSECRIGAFEVGCLSSALRRNETLEELQVWGDTVGSKGAEELSQMIEVNSSLKQITLEDENSASTAPVIAAVLARNRAMSVHIWNREGKNMRSKVAEFIPETCTLRIHKLKPSGSERVACALGWNTTVSTLNMAGVRLSTKWTKVFREILEQNRSLKSVILSRTCLRDKAIVYVAAGLFKNQSVENLHLDGNRFGGMGLEHLLCPLSRFSRLQNQANTALKSIAFGGGRTKIGREGIAAILQMLETNQTLVRLGIYDDQSLRPNDIIRIFKSLERNSTLRCLSLRGCKGVDGELVLQAITETLQVNPWIEEIDLAGTPLQIAGKSESISQKLGQRERTEHEDEQFRDLPRAAPMSCRIFFCGQGYAGKSTLCNTIIRNSSTAAFPSWRQAVSLVNPAELRGVRKEEIKIKTLQHEGIKVSIWVLAGQQEFYTLHDLMFQGNRGSLFLIISSLFQKPANKEERRLTGLEEDLLHWLRYIASNTARAKPQSILPHVTIVLTHSDKISKHSENMLPIVDLVHNLRERFRGIVELHATVFTVDARSTRSVSKLTHHLQKTVQTIIQRVPQVYQLTNDFIKILQIWRSENENRPTMKWNDFGELCQLKVPLLRIRTRHDTRQVESQRCEVAKSLHYMGEVIFFEELGFLILDCEWFCREFLGHLIKLKPGNKNTMDRNGFMSRKELEKLLRGSINSQDIEEDDLIHMMLKLELCYELHPGDRNSLLFVPTILEGSRVKTRKWQLTISECFYVGRKLECDNSCQTYFGPSFFPRLQVHLYNKLQSKNPHAATYNLEKYLITITINGVDIRVELGGQPGHYIDVLACSTKNTTEILRLLMQLIFPTIQSLASGVSLVEKIIRPDCVRHLIPHRYRKGQAVLLGQLKQALLSVPADMMYDYQHTWDSVLHQRYYDLHHLAVELSVSLEQAESESQAHVSEPDFTVEPSVSGIAKGVETVLQRLKIIEHEIKDLRREIYKLRYYEHILLVELHRKIDYMVNYNIQLEERKIPRMFYFIQTEGNSRRLVTRLISGMTELRLHMLCEFRREMHVVQDQVGCDLIQVDNQAVKCLLPYMSTFMKLVTFALKIGVHFVAGMGEMVPDLAREVAHLVNASHVSEMTAFTAGVVGTALIAGQATGNRATDRGVPLGGRSLVNFRHDVTAAQQWLTDFLKNRRITSGKDIAERFGLWRVRYLDDGHIGWICRQHRERRASEVIDVPS
ncbi:unnamed protein product [Spirodela intermedia]|uniref:Uncharacterized protein n=1 Tax=Spirodela intermedia TaxID=51605 RepID=A0A7I8I7T6_SPIIN|nr:unnamed protein product [Spirodela intermedia]CAA6653619.1 unnamed protein product [Spirodela intermedia]